MALHENPMLMKTINSFTSIVVVGTGSLKIRERFMQEKK
jgi:hypothetical protein